MRCVKCGSYAINIDPKRGLQKSVFITNLFLVICFVWLISLIKMGIKKNLILVKDF